jgi:undecaprenyl diphosphate synthase
MLENQVLDPKRIPRHVAIIMDGNGRWAKQRNLPRIMGHKAGTESVKDIVKTARELNLEVLTLYAFSTENWKRPSVEVQSLMTLLKTYLKSEMLNMLENDISLLCIGEIEKLPADVQKILAEVIAWPKNVSMASLGRMIFLNSFLLPIFIPGDCQTLTYSSGPAVRRV